MYVVHFRHPIDRILSQYNFEWRWGCKACTVTSISKAQMKGAQRNKYNSMRWMIEIQPYEKEIEDEMKKYKLSATYDMEIYQNIMVESVMNKISFNFLYS